MINGSYKITGLIGSNINRSLSYLLHNHALKNLNIEGVYLPFVVSPQELYSFVQTLRTTSFVGANVTLPHKENVLPFMDRLDRHASRIGAVNTIIAHQDGSLTGANSDGLGFLAALDQAAIQYTNRPVFIIGAGGAARAIVDALSPHAQSITIFNRTTARAHSLIAHCKPHFPQQHYTICTDPHVHPLTRDTLLVQCTPQGSNGKIRPPHPPLHPQMTVVDLIYRDTPLLCHARSLGAQVQNGTAMLYHQASLSFSWWFKTSPPANLMEQALNIRKVS